mmetsp:Transcript_29661/g.33286  ORF Transcript_29661/g.33286 Transcript_29661/m.33286 type:complete len:207 (-) Transcript_29661:4149-4769(-)
MAGCASKTGFAKVSSSSLSDILLNTSLATIVISRTSMSGHGFSSGSSIEPFFAFLFFDEDVATDLVCLFLLLAARFGSDASSSSSSLSSLSDSTLGYTSAPLKFSESLAHRSSFDSTSSYVFLCVPAFLFDRLPLEFSESLAYRSSSDSTSSYVFLCDLAFLFDRLPGGFVDRGDVCLRFDAGGGSFWPSKSLPTEEEHSLLSSEY